MHVSNRVPRRVALFVGVVSFAMATSCSKVVPPVLAKDTTSARSAAGRSAPQAAFTRASRGDVQVPGTPSDERIAEYSANRSGSVIELQQFRELTSLPPVEAGAINASLIDLNPNVGTWYILRLGHPGGETASYHLESQPGVRLKLDPAFPTGLTLEHASIGPEQSSRCDLWSATNAGGFADSLMCT